MLIKFIQLLCTPYGVHPVNSVMEVEKEKAERFIRDKVAVAVVEEAPPAPKEVAAPAANETEANPVEAVEPVKKTRK